MSYLLYIALIFSVTTLPGYVGQAMAFNGPPVHVAPTDGKASRGPAVRRDGTLVLSKRRLGRLEAIHQKSLENPKKDKWATREYYKALTQSGGAHLTPDGKRGYSLLGRLYGLPLAGAGIAGGGFGLAGIAHVGTVYNLAIGKMSLAALGSTLFTTAGLAGAALLTAGIAAAVGGTVALVGVGMRIRTNRVKLPGKNDVNRYVKRLLAGESPAKLMQTRPEDAPGPGYAPGADHRAAQELAAWHQLAQRDPVIRQRLAEMGAGNAQLDPTVQQELDALTGQQFAPEETDPGTDHPDTNSADPATTVQTAPTQ